MSVVHGVKHTVRHGVQHGIFRADFPVDPTSGKGVPVTQADWDAVFAAAGVTSKTLSHSYGFQDASGNITAAVGTNLTVTGTLNYQQAESGWQRTATVITETSNERAVLAAGAAPNMASASGLFFSYSRLSTAGGAGRGVIGLVGASGVQTRLGTDNLATFCVGVTTNGSATTGTMRPYVLRYNRTAGAVHSFTEAQSRSGTYSASPIDGEKGWGNTGNPAAQAVLLGAIFSGANAEWTDNELRSVLQVLGWTVAW